MPLGDSITMGFTRAAPCDSNTCEGYRYHLASLLENENFNFTFVGSEIGGMKKFKHYRCAGFQRRNSF